MGNKILLQSLIIWLFINYYNLRKIKFCYQLTRLTFTGLGNILFLTWQCSLRFILTLIKRCILSLWQSVFFFIKISNFQNFTWKQNWIKNNNSYSIFYPSFWFFKHRPLVTVASEYCLMVHVHWSRGGHHLYTYMSWRYLYTYKRYCKVSVFNIANMYYGQLGQRYL